MAQTPLDPPQHVNSIESTVSIESTLKIFPNPAKGTVTINMKLPLVSNAKISLHDMLGNEVELLAENVSGVFEKTYDIHSIRAGIYFVRINYGNISNTIVRKIIIQ